MEAEQRSFLALREGLGIREVDDPDEYEDDSSVLADAKAQADAQLWGIFTTTTEFLHRWASGLLDLPVLPQGPYTPRAAHRAARLAGSRSRRARCRPRPTGPAEDHRWPRRHNARPLRLGRDRGGPWPSAPARLQASVRGLRRESRLLRAALEWHHHPLAAAGEAASRRARGVRRVHAPLGTSLAGFPHLRRVAAVLHYRRPRLAGLGHLGHPDPARAWPISGQATRLGGLTQYGDLTPRGRTSRRLYPVPASRRGVARQRGARRRFARGRGLSGRERARVTAASPA